MNQQIKDLINSEIENSEVCLFMKGTPDTPQCGFSMAISNMLKILDINFKGINVLENENLRQGIKEFIGGCDIVKEMYENGELIKLLQSKNINFNKKN